MKKAIVRILVVLGAVYLFTVIYVVALMYARKPSVPRRTVLEVDLERSMVEFVASDPVAQIMAKDRPVIRDLVDALDKAGDDQRVAGLIARIGAVPMGMAQVQEIREAVSRFRAKSKFAVAYSETFGEFGPGNNAYYLATAFDQIWLQPSGDIGLTGIMLESPFVTGTLEKLGMKFHGDHRYEYKSALNLLTQKKFTPPEREEDKAVIDSWFAQMRDGICDARHLPKDQFQSLVDHGPYLGTEAMTAKLVDGLAYRDEVYDQVKKKAGEGAKLLYLNKYLEAVGRPNRKGKVIALIFGVGQVTRGKSSFDPTSGSGSMGSETVAAAFRAAIDDRDVKAILFRVDSPGGSYVASDTISREVVRARKSGKPVIVSMGDLAGSGGYFVAMAADKIVAQPGTITASIGVLGGKFLTSGFWNKIGLTWDNVRDGANSNMWTSTMDYTPQQWERFEAWLDRVYNDFTSKVADDRHLPKEKVLQIAKGRIWTGADAKSLGLVDQLGGFHEALDLAKQSAGIPVTSEVHIKVYPRPKSLLDVILSPGPDNSDKEATEVAIVRVLERVQPFMRQLQTMGARDADDVLRMPAPQSTR